MQATLYEVQSSPWAPLLSWTWAQRMAGKFYAWRAGRKHARYAAFHRQRSERLGTHAPDCPPPPTEAEIIGQLRAELHRLRVIVERQPGWEGMNDEPPASELIGTAAVVMENAEQFERVICDEGIKEGDAVLIEEGEEIPFSTQCYGSRLAFSRGVVLRFCRGHAVVNVQDERGKPNRTANVAYYFLRKAPEVSQP